MSDAEQVNLPDRTSINFHVTVQGVNMQVTIRDSDELNALARAKRFLEHMGNNQAVAPTADALPVTPPVAPASPERKPCPLHPGEDLLLFPKPEKRAGKQTWWAHKIMGTEDWCKGEKQD